MLNKGLMTPSPASPARRANTPRPITTTPADLKNNGACFECAKDTEPNESNASIGSVPRANANIIKSPDINDPLESAETCIDCVNPQGKKNVPTPIRIGANVACSNFRKYANMPVGNVALFFLIIPTKFKPRRIITLDAIIPSIAENIKLTPIALPKRPSNPPSRANPASLPPWNNINCFLLVFVFSSCEIFAESDRISPPTIAKQLETEAIRPIIKLVVGVVAPPIPRFKMPDF